MAMSCNLLVDPKAQGIVGKTHPLHCNTLFTCQHVVTDSHHFKTHAIRLEPWT
jgi:hypothetical protein